jgi:hypothetical protein
MKWTYDPSPPHGGASPPPPWNPSSLDIWHPPLAIGHDPLGCHPFIPIFFPSCLPSSLPSPPLSLLTSMGLPLLVLLPPFLSFNMGILRACFCYLLLSCPFPFLPPSLTPLHMIQCPLPFPFHPPPSVIVVFEYGALVCDISRKFPPSLRRCDNYIASSTKYRRGSISLRLKYLEFTVLIHIEKLLSQLWIGTQ